MWKRSSKPRFAPEFDGLHCFETILPFLMPPRTLTLFSILYMYDHQPLDDCDYLFNNLEMKFKILIVELS